MENFANNIEENRIKDIKSYPNVRKQSFCYFWSSKKFLNCFGKKFSIYLIPGYTCKSRIRKINFSELYFPLEL